MGQEQQKYNNKALWIFPNFRETINSLPPKMRGRAWETLIEISFGNENFSKNLQNEKLFVQMAIKSLLPLIRLRNIGGSKNGESNNPSGRRKDNEDVSPNVGANVAPNVSPNVGANVAPNVSPNVGASPLYNNNNNNNSNNNSNINNKSSVKDNNKDTRAKDCSDSQDSKKDNKLPVFGKYIASIYEPSMNEEQFKIWFDRNKKVFNQILVFCGNNMQKGFIMIQSCKDKLSASNLTFSYESVIRRATDYYDKACKLYDDGYRMNRLDGKFVLSKSSK